MEATHSTAPKSTPKPRFPTVAPVHRPRRASAAPRLAAGLAGAHWFPGVIKGWRHSVRRVMSRQPMKRTNNRREPSSPAGRSAARSPKRTRTTAGTPASGGWLRWGGVLVVATALVYGTWLSLRPAGSRTSAPGNPPTPAPAPTAAAASTGVPPADEPLTSRLRRGNELLAQNKSAEAAEVFSEAVKTHPNDEDARYNLGIALARLGKIDEAIQQYQEALRIFPDYLEAHNNLGNLLARRPGRIQEAVDHFRRAIQIMPDYPAGHNNLGTALQQKGEWAEALSEFEKAVTLYPDYWEARYNLGQALLRQGNSERARAELQKVLEARPDFKPARAALERASKAPDASPAPSP